MSPRRSSRARTIQPPPAAPNHTISSNSSVSSGRAERSTRSHHKLPSPHEPVSRRSQSLEDPDEPPKPIPRRTRSGLDETKEKPPPNVEDDEEDEVDEEEVTRCICGQTEYPGLPTLTTDPQKPAAKDDDDMVPSTNTLPEDMGGLFIQCDICKVWQHGGCVGILDEGMSPEEYFCEQCRKDLHRITATPKGQKYSRYLPVQEESSPPISPARSQEGSLGQGNSNSSARPSAEVSSHKRRSTMNSRDAAYEEQIQRAIEASKREEGAPSVDDEPRRNKRSRSVTEEQKEPIKRQRTTSNSSLPSFNKVNALPASSSDEKPVTGKIIESSPKKIRGAAAKNHREKELREQRERERADAAKRRKARSERRRGDESDHSEDPPSRTTSKREPETVLHVPPSPDTPPAPPEPPSKSSYHKKTGRPPNKRGRVGRNQYTKDRDPPVIHNRNASLEVAEYSLMTRGRSRSASNARDAGNNSGAVSGTNGNGNGNGNGWGEVGKPSKPKHMNPNRTSLNEMKRRVAGILDFVSRVQNELGEARTPPSSGGGSRGTGSGSVNGDGGGGGSGSGGRAGGKDMTNPQTFVEGVLVGLVGLQVDGTDERDFSTLGSADMMNVLKGKLIGWQREYGVWGSK